VSPYPNPEDTHTKFWNTEPPSFSNTTEHLEADDWITTIEHKLDMVQCNDREKVLFASGQLVGVASEWWNSYIYEHEQPQSIVWKEFKDNFITHFIPVSTMKLKRKEFLSLKQGQMTVTEYRDKFIQLSMYAPRSSGSDKKKREHFLKRLNEDLQSILSLHEYSSLQDVINKAIELENKLQEIMSKKRKKNFLEQRDNSSHLYHLSQALEDEYEDPPRNRRNLKESGACFYCKDHGHFINRCPKKRADLYEKKAQQRHNKQTNAEEIA
jgi:hypothetical protein